MPMIGIYQIRNTINGKAYTGSSQDCRRRFSEHRSKLRRGVHVNLKLQCAWNKYGEPAFEFSVIFCVISRDTLESIEQEFLDLLDAVRNGYNLAPVAGNTSGWKASDETRRRMSDAAKRRDNSLQVVAMANATRGKKRPQHVIDAMLAGKMAKPITESTRRRMSESAKARGNTITPHAMERLREISRARSLFSDEQRAQMSAMRHDGKTLGEIGEHFGITALSSVHRNIRVWRDHNEPR